jgi:hypothetical protein
MAAEVQGVEEGKGWKHQKCALHIASKQYLPHSSQQGPLHRRQQEHRQQDPKGCLLIVLDSLSTFEVVLMLKQRTCNLLENEMLIFLGAMDVITKLVKASAITSPMAEGSTTSALPRNMYKSFNEMSNSSDVSG